MTWKQRLIESLEPVLALPDPRPKISVYHDMPYAIFHYPPEDEFAVRVEITLMQTRLEQRGKRVTRISLSDCLAQALAAENMSSEALAKAEREHGSRATIETIHSVLDEYQPLNQLVADQLPKTADPLLDVVFITRAGALFPVYRTSSLLEQLKGKVHVPSVLFYPGAFDGTAGLSFMGVSDPEPNYRPKIF